MMAGTNGLNGPFVAATEYNTEAGRALMVNVLDRTKKLAPADLLYLLEKMMM